MKWLSVALILTLLLSATIAIGHVFRYAPMSGDMEVSYVWDRWLHRVCVISFAMKNQLSCSLEAFTAAASPAGHSTSPLGNIEHLRQAGFSDKEILEHVEKEIKAKRQRGLPEEAIANEIFGAGGNPSK